MGFITAIVVGGLAGWVASMIMGKDGSMGVIGNIIVGIIGGVIAGGLLPLVGLSVGAGVLGSFIGSLIGAVILLFVIGLFTRAA